MRASYQVFGDWGTSRLRLYLASASTIHGERDGPGIGALTDTPHNALRTALAPWREHHGIDRVVLCGMAGSRNGLIEVPYAALPAGTAEWSARRSGLQIDGLDIVIGAGLCAASAPGPPDVMRGEETQLFGAMQLHPRLAHGRHLVVLPGTHSKWTQLEEGRVTGFTTYITGELFALLRQHSTLLKAGGDPGEDAGSFTDGLRRSAERPRGLTAVLFETRSAQLIQHRTPAWGAHFLSGLLIGAEIQDALAEHAGHRTLTVVGDPRLTSLYARALEQRNIGHTEIDGADCAIAGLRLLAHFAATEN